MFNWFRRPILSVALFLCLLPPAVADSSPKVTFDTKADPLNAGNQISVIIADSKRGSFGQLVTIAVYAVCNDKNKNIVVGIIPGEVIFPSTQHMTTATVLHTRIRFKFDTDADGTDEIWTTTSDYKTVLTSENTETFTEKLGTANSLSARIGDTNIDFTMPLSGTSESISKLLAKCGS